MSEKADIFKAYDVRGLSPEEINDTTAYKIGCSFSRFVGRGVVVVGRDNRETSLGLKEKLVKGLVSAGSRVIDLGLSSTPMFYFAVGFLKADGGVCITASHNPKEYNGFKLVGKEAIPIFKGFGLEKIKEKFLRLEFSEREGGSEEEKDLLDEYIDFVFKNFNSSDFEDFKIIIDTANAVAGLDVSKFKEKFEGKIVNICSELDNSLPNPELNPLLKENIEDLKEEVKKEKANLGVAFDGDGDRIIFVDEKGEMVRPDIILGIIFSSIIKERSGSVGSPQERVAYDFRVSNVIKELIIEKGGVPIPERAGNPFIKQAMRKNETTFSGEISGHYFHKDYFYSECPFFVLLKIMEIMKEKKKTLSELAKSIEQYAYSGEINFEIKDDNILEKIENHYSDGQVTKIDGVRVDFENWWFSLRKSNTQPLIRLVIEAQNSKLLEEKKEELISLIK